MTIEGTTTLILSVPTLGLAEVLRTSYQTDVEPGLTAIHLASVIREALLSVLGEVGEEQFFLRLKELEKVLELPSGGVLSLLNIPARSE